MATLRIKITLIPIKGEKIERYFSSPTLVLGRSKSCDFIVESESLSRRHCQIDYEENQFFITDLGSTNGVFVEGVRIPPNTKTAFKNILPLQISEFDCRVLDQTDVAENEATETIKIDLKKFKKSLKPVKSPEETKSNTINFFISILFVMLVGVYGYHELSEDSQEAIPQEVVVRDEASTTSKPIENKVVEIVNNEFLIDAEYLEYHERINCEEKLYCDNLFLRLEDREGLFKVDKDYTVYMKPSKHLSNKKFSSLTEKEADLIAFDYFLTSRILNDYFLKKIGQLHLVLVGVDNRPKKVYRFNRSLYNVPVSKSKDVYKILQSSITEPKPEAFRDVISALVPTRELP